MAEIEEVEGFYFPSVNCFTEDKKTAISFVKRHGYKSLTGSYNDGFHYWSTFEADHVKEVFYTIK